MTSSIEVEVDRELFTIINNAQELDPLSKPWSLQAE